ncbi:MAG: UDP-glucose/GDP-mannose dehydrogenase family protein [Dehalococcoidia bacterium]|nr:UDP-glucose/GDP-mannose dehydrogenase family protein [Dehalococcoidia bacterium]
MVAEVARTPAPGAPAPVRSLTVTVLGAGYVGLVSGACLAELGHHVTVTEIDERRLGALRSGMVPIRERGLDDIVDRQVAAGLLRFEDARTVDVTKSDVVMVAVGTPSQADGRVELGHVEAAVRQIARGNPRALVVIKSTVPPGTCDRMQALAHAEGGTGVRVVSNPEFLREGRAVQDFMQPDRVVIGARDAADAAIVEQLYAPLDASVLHCSPEEAELSKYAANALLAARISFINEMSAIADRIGADITRVSSIVGSDARIGPAFLGAGLGWGGSCFPKDVHGLARVAEDLGLAAPMLTATIEANLRQRQRALGAILELVGARPDARVALLGLAFKPETDDVRESPAVWLAHELHERGIAVRATDPWALANAERVGPRVTYTLDPMRAVDGADVTVLATEWPEFVALDWPEVARRMRGDAVLDARNALPSDLLRSSGLVYRSLGRDVLGR